MKTIAWLVCVCAGLALCALPGAAQEAKTMSDVYLNVRDYGAKGDKVTDDTAAIEAAIKAAGTPDVTGAVRSTVLFFPVGVYRVTKTLEFKDPQIRVTRIEGSGVIGKTDMQCQLLYDGLAGGTLLSFAPFAGTKIEEISLNGNGKAGTLLRIVSVPGWASFGTYISRVHFTKADTGIEVGDGFDSCSSDMTFVDLSFSDLKKNAFRAMNNQNVDYVFIRCAVGVTPVAYYFSKGGNAHFLMPTFYRCDTAFKIETGGICAGVYSVTGLQLENFSYNDHKKRMVVLEASGELNIAFNSIFTGCINVFGKEGDRTTPNFILHSSAQVTVRDSMISGRIAVLDSDPKPADKSNLLATWLQFENCRFRCAADPLKDIRVTGNAGYALRNCHAMCDDVTVDNDYEATFKPQFIRDYVKYPAGVKVLKEK